jgi:hypothetical protein
MRTRKVVSRLVLLGTLPEAEWGFAMRLFQNGGTCRAYLTRFRALDGGRRTFVEKLSTILNDRLGGPHFLRPVLDGSPDAFFMNGEDPVLQRTWAH